MGAMKLGRAVVCSALLAAGLLTTGVCAASVAQADFCGAKEDPFSCTARLDAGPPTSAESAFIQSDQMLTDGWRSVPGFPKL